MDGSQILSDSKCVRRKGTPAQGHHPTWIENLSETIRSFGRLTKKGDRGYVQAVGKTAGDPAPKQILLPTEEHDEPFFKFTKK